jgi:hypothetical protein
MNINDLCGKELDKFGKEKGVKRYHGFSHIETDAEYRKSIMAAVKAPDFVEIPYRDYWCVFLKIGDCDKILKEVFIEQRAAISYVDVSPNVPGDVYMIAKCKLGYRIDFEDKENTLIAGGFHF